MKLPLVCVTRAFCSGTALATAIGYTVLVLDGDFVHAAPPSSHHASASQRPRLLVTSDGEMDDECSMVRFLLYANEWDIEGIVTSSSQYHWHGHKWAGDDLITPYLAAYAKVHLNLLKQDSPAFLHAIPTGLWSVESPGWGGRYTRVRDNTWLDPVADPAYKYPDVRWYGNSA